MKCQSKRNYYGQRSVPISRTGTVIPADRPSYYSKIINGDHYGAIFNSPDRNRFYINGVETTQFISEGDAISGWKTFESGCEHTYDFLLLDMKYYDGLGIRINIRGTCKSCDNNGITSCTIRTTHTAKVENASGNTDYNWEVAGGSLKSGQGTDTIVVETRGIYSVKVGVRCTATDTYTSAYDEEDCIHRRTHNKIGDTILVPHVALKPAKDLVPYTGRIQ